MTTKHILTKQQREAGLDTFEDDHNLFLTAPPLYVHHDYPELNHNNVIAIFDNHTTIVEIQRAANNYLIERGK